MQNALETAAQQQDVTLSNKFGTGGRGRGVVRATSAVDSDQNEADHGQSILISFASSHPYSIPLQRPLTTRDKGSHRLGALFYLEGQEPDESGETGVALMPDAKEVEPNNG